MTENYLRWGLIYLAAGTVCLAILLARSDPFDRLERLLRAVIGFFKR